MSKLLAEQAAEDTKIESEDKYEEATFEEKEQAKRMGLPNFQLASTSDIKVAEDKCGRVVELLENSGTGASYIGKMYINGQKLDTIWDTGSDEPVVNSIYATLNMMTPCLDAFGN